MKDRKKAPQKKMKDRKRRTHLLHHIDLPPDLWPEILVRLPVKSLLRFRCVCKTWCSLIDDHGFISMHLNLYWNNFAKTQLLVRERMPKSVLNSIYTIRRSDNFRKIGQLVNSQCRSVHESEMIHGLKLMYYYSKNLVEFSLWNPSIRKSWKLPVCPVKCTISRHRCFLGFAHSSGDYKVVAFENVNAVACEMAIAIYSLRDHRWTVKHNRMKVSKRCFNMMYYGRGALFFQGAVYWRPPCFKWDKEDTELFSFDFNTEEFQYLMLPNIEAEMNRFLFIFGDSLAFFCISELRSCIWILEKNGGNELWRQCWDSETNVDLYKFFEHCMMKDYRFFYFEHTGMLLVQCFRELIAYNIRSNRAHYLGKSVSLLDVETYVESLVLHKAYEGADSISVVRQRQQQYKMADSKR